MAIFNGHIVTNDGRNLLGRALAGAGKIVFTKAAFGQGKYTGDLREIKELVDKRLDCVVSDILNDRGTVNIKIQITNENLTQAFRTEEFGVYAKIEGDTTEILYCYAVAQESDSIPDNSFGDTFMGEYIVYIAFSSDAEADIYIKEGAVFLTKDTADKSYVIIDLEAKGDLSSRRTSLEADKIYKADDGKWYKNIGGDRSWISGNGIPDELLKLISWEQIYKDLDKPFGTEEGEILEGKRFAQALGLEFGGELNNSELKESGKAYWDSNNKSIFKCLADNTLNYADSNYYEAISNNDLLLKLQNLTNENRFQFEIGGITLVLTKFGKIIMCIVQHKGQIVDAALPKETIPEAFRGEYTVYLSAPCITGSPYIALKTDGGVEFRINGATFQVSTNATTYFLAQSYFSKLY
ncbi:hypothetical protein [Fusobacterium sp. THCT1E2]